MERYAAPLTGLLTGLQVAEALERVSHALAARRGSRKAARLLAALLQRYELNPEISVSPRGLQAAFAFADVDRQALCNGAFDYLKFQPSLADALARGRADGWDAAATGLLRRKNSKLLRDRLFTTALTHGVVMDLELEFLLTALRRRLLLSPDLLQERPNFAFACTLIRHCLNNAHVFFADDEERAALGGLRVDFDALFGGDAAAGVAFTLVSLYKPFHETLGDSLARDAGKVSPRALRAVLQDELDARRQEAAHAESLDNLTAVTDETSQRVAVQYADDPYPRWLSLQAPESGSARARMQHYFSEDALGAIDGPCDVLVAGAGTGRQAIDAAIAYGPEANLLAIDLSAPSLAYGVRMAQELNVSNLHFAVGDILRLDGSCGDFDAIECVGVLHHLADPLAGWRALTDRLRPGGLMLIGLYSALSRQVIRALSEDPDWPGPDAGDHQLRAYRRKLMHRPSGDDGIALTDSPDFFTKSGFRDLTLHVSERQFTLPEIRDFLAAEGLDFHGFVLSDDSMRSYADAFPDDGPAGTLDNWWAFEQANPRTFSGMYLFWCRRPE